jgi:hypothetical protein
MPIKPMDNKSSAQDNQNPINKSTPKDELGKLKKIRRALYRREEDTIRQSRQKRNDRFNILTRSLPPTRVDELDISLRQSMLHASSDRKKWLYLAAAALVTIIIVGAIIGVFFNRRLTSVSENQIGLTIKGPLAITAGDTINIAIELGNFSHIDWESVELLVTLPDGFTLISSEPTLNDEGRQKTLLVGRLAKRATKTVTLSGRAIGALNTNLVTHAELIITPENFPGGRFSKTSEIITIIDNAPVELNVNIPGETKSGQTVIADITVKNTGADDIENAYVKLTPGAGVQLNQTDPQFSPEFNFFKSEWLVANLNSGDEVVMRAVFFANGLPGDTRSLTVELGIIQDQTRFLQISQESLLKIAATQLSISQSYNGSKTQLVATAGEKIEGLVDFVNTGSTLQQDIEINLKIEGHAFDPTTLDLSVGHFEAATNTIK